MITSQLLLLTNKNSDEYLREGTEVYWEKSELNKNNSGKNQNYFYFCLDLYLYPDSMVLVHLYRILADLENSASFLPLYPQK